MAEYSQLDFPQITELTALYDIEATAFEPMSGGWNNSSFQVSSEAGEYVLTVFESRTFREVEGLGSLLAHLGEHRFQTTPVRSLGAGGFATNFDGKPVLVKERVEGDVIERLSLEHLVEAGAALARLHEVPPPPGLIEGHVYALEDYPQVVARPGDSFAAWLVERKSEFDQVMAAQSVPAGLAHGDLFADNILYSETELRAVIDFEDACHYPFVADIGMAVVGLVCQGFRVDLKRTRALLAGYQGLRPLQEGEKKALRTSILWAAAGTACWRYRRFRLRSFDPQHCDRYLEMVELADSLGAISDDELISTLGLGEDSASPQPSS